MMAISKTMAVIIIAIIDAVRFMVLLSRRRRHPARGGIQMCSGAMGRVATSLRPTQGTLRQGTDQCASSPDMVDGERVAVRATLRLQHQEGPPTTVSTPA